jgi:hypothetical protein
MENNFNVTDETIQFYTKVFFLNFQTESRDQLTNMVSSAIAFSDCYEDLNKEKKQLKLIMDEPIENIKKMYYKKFPRNTLDRWDNNFTLADLEWISFRDTRFQTRLKTEYYSDGTRPTRQFLTLKDVVTLRGYLKVQIASIFSAMVKKKHVNLRPSLLDSFDNKPISAVGEK